MKHGKKKYKSIPQNCISSVTYRVRRQTFSQNWFSKVSSSWLSLSSTVNLAKGDLWRRQRCSIFQPIWIKSQFNEIAGSLSSCSTIIQLISSLPVSCNTSFSLRALLHDTEIDPSLHTSAAKTNAWFSSSKEDIKDSHVTNVGGRGYFSMAVVTLLAALL